MPRFLAEDGQEAIRLTESEKDFDIILMDIKLPGMSGMETMKVLKEKNPGQLIIAQTAYARAEDELVFRRKASMTIFPNPSIPLI